ncbi:MAG TPA: hypothetical protein VFE84_03235 [Patescibacteria group bacterium]|nr:hypothetical protein [Patescibacteria group bacterium]
MKLLLAHLLPVMDWVWAALGTALAVPLLISGPGALSSQVLRLLTRDNEWSGTQTFDNGTLLLDQALAAPTDVTNRLYNIGGNIFWNGALVTTAAGLGTVTSVDLTVPSILTVTGGPVTSAGTFAVDLATQAANQILSGPPTGADDVPTFRGLVDADIPDDITINGTSNVTWASVNKAGSSLADLATKDASVLSGLLALVRITDTGTAGQPLQSSGGAGPQYAALNLSTATNTSGTLPAARMPAITGDATSSAGTVALTLANSGVAAATYGSASAVPVLTIDAKGRVTAATTASLTGTFLPSLIFGAARGAALIGNATPQFAVLTPTVTGSILRFDGTDTSWSTDGSGLTALNATQLTTGVAAVARGGLGQGASPTDGQIPIGKTADGSYLPATLTGTANQVTVTNGANSITLSLPQSIATASAPQFARIGAGTGPDAVAPIYAFGPIKRRIVSNGSSGAAFSLDLSTADEHQLTLTAAPCVLTLNNPIAGAIYRLYLLQDGTGNRTVTWPAAVKWTAGTAPTLTTTASKTDLITLVYDGTSYFGSSSLNY